MASSVQFVTRSKRQSHMPEWTPEFAELVEHISTTGVLAGAAKRLRFAHKRGLPVLALGVFFLTLACGTWRCRATGRARRSTGRILSAG